MHHQFRLFARAELRRKVFVDLGDLLEAAQDRFEKYHKNDFLAAIIIDPEIDFTKVGLSMMFVAPGVLALVDKIWVETQIKKAA